MGVLWRLRVPLTRKQIVANCPHHHQLPLSSVCGRVNELLARGFIECEQTVFDPDTRKHVQALTLTDEGFKAISEANDAAANKSATSGASAKRPAKRSTPSTYAKRAGILCGDYDFCCYVHERDQAMRDHMRIGEDAAVFPRRPAAEKRVSGRAVVCECYADRAAAWLRTELLIGSRSEIDSNEEAQEGFEQIVWEFARWVAVRGRPALVLKMMGVQ
ncbi:hypothetical protein [Carnimonas bestiolae]